MQYFKWIFLLLGIIIGFSKSQNSQEENKLALEIRGLINKEIKGSDCPCINVLQCDRTRQILEKTNELSKNHPERSTIIAHIRNLSRTCDIKNKEVRCCDGTWKPQASKNECGNPFPNPNPFVPKIIDGLNAELGNYPFMALLGYKTNQNRGRAYDYNCGGTVINKYYILTAAHCMIRRNPDVVILGEYDLRQDPDDSNAAKRTVIEIEEIILHEDYSKFRQGGVGPNDIALIRVKQPIPFYNPRNPQESNIKPICLPWNFNDPGRKIFEGDILRVLGWGRVTNDKILAEGNHARLGAGSAILQYLDVPAISKRKCKEYEAFKNHDLKSSHQLCAGGEDGRDSCNGDSGGPLIQQANAGTPWFLAGVVSFGTAKCGTGTPGVYTRVSVYIPWIEKNLKP